MKKISGILLAAALFVACDKKDTQSLSEKGIVISVNDGTGCGYVINLDSGKKIEPINTTESKVQPFMVNNKRVSVTYTLRSDFVTPCQNASAAKIDEISSAN